MAAAMIVPFMCQLALAQTATPAKPAAKPAAKPSVAPGPKGIGKYGDWQAATHVEGGQLVCYAFTRAQSSEPALPGRGDVVLTVTQRPNLRDAVAITAGFTYAANAAVIVDDGTQKLDFYTAQRSAFARDGHAVVEAFGKGKQAVAKGPGPRSGTITDSFSLRGFEAAYAAIAKALSGAGPNPVPLDQAYDVMRIIALGELSSRERRVALWGDI